MGPTGSDLEFLGIWNLGSGRVKIPDGVLNLYYSIANKLIGKLHRAHHCTTAPLRDQSREARDRIRVG